jgi:hypothetical protein
MNRKAFRSGVLVLFLGVALVFPAAAATSGSRSPRPAEEQGILWRLRELAAGLFGEVRAVIAIRSLQGANRGGIDPNGLDGATPGAPVPPPGERVDGQVAGSGG